MYDKLSTSNTLWQLIKLLMNAIQTQGREAAILGAAIGSGM